MQGCKDGEGATITFAETKANTWQVPCTGKFKIELWGAQGNYYKNSSPDVAGKGGYVSGSINLQYRESFYIYVGEHSHDDNKMMNAMFNAGSISIGYVNSTHQSSSGGGATDIRTLKTSSWNDINSLRSRIMVASGGGGTFMHGGVINDGNTTDSIGGSGGGLTGYFGIDDHYDKYSYCRAYGGTQVAGGEKVSSTQYGSNNTSGSFGIGGNGPTEGASPHGGGGGGGYYGGGSGSHHSGYCAGAGGGGSSFVSGHTGCIAVVSASNTSARAGTGGSTCTTGTTDNLCSRHYSNYIFSDTTIIDGKGCYWNNTVTSTCTGQPKISGSGTQTGNSGNGYARITILE